MTRLPSYLAICSSKGIAWLVRVQAWTIQEALDKLKKHYEHQVDFKVNEIQSERLIK